MEKEADVHIDTPKDHIEELFSRSKEYLETRLELVKLQAAEKSSDVASSIVTRLLIVVVFTLFFFALNIGLGLLIGDLLGEAYLGFLILAAVYLITGIVLHSGRNKWIKEPINTMIIKKIFKNS